MPVRDFLQGASNAAADTVAGPVDLISWALRGVGVPVGPSPVGGSAWMRERGLTAPARGAGGLLGEAAGLSAPIVAAAKAPQIARGLLALDDAAMEQARKAVEGQMVRMGGIQPATVWHGSPYKFDKFDSAHIGKGEGAQAYGHGLYLAESPGVAGHYAKALPARVDTPEFWAGKSLPKDLTMAEADELGRLGQEMMKNGTLSAEKMQTWRRLMDRRQLFREAIDAQKPQSNLYKVDLPDDMIARMLDWDKPLSQQAPEVQKAAKDLGISPMVARDTSYGGPAQREMVGRELYSIIDRRGSLNNPGSSKAMRAAGISGIRYLDGGSRGAGAGTSNYVVFPGEEGALTILERNGKPRNLLGDY